MDIFFHKIILLFVSIILSLRFLFLSILRLGLILLIFIFPVILVLIILVLIFVDSFLIGKFLRIHCLIFLESITLPFLVVIIFRIYSNKYIVSYLMSTVHLCFFDASSLVLIRSLTFSNLIWFMKTFLKIIKMIMT